MSSRSPTAPTWSTSAYREFLGQTPPALHIATACPAVVEYVRKYHPELTEQPHADRLADGRHGAGRQGAATAQRRALRLRRPVRGQEGRGARPRGAAGDRRGAHAQEAHRVLAERGVDLAAAAEAGLGRAGRRAGAGVPAARRPARERRPRPRHARPGRARGQRPERHDRGARQPRHGRHRQDPAGGGAHVQRLLLRAGHQLRRARPPPQAPRRRVRGREPAAPAGGAAGRGLATRSLPSVALATRVPRLALLPRPPAASPPAAGPRLHRRRPAQRGAERGQDPRHPRAHQQVLPRGRAQLRRLRLRDVPRQGGRRARRYGRGGDVPAVRPRPGRARLRTSSTSPGTTCATCTVTSSTRRSLPPWARWRPASRTSSTTR